MQPNFFIFLYSSFFSPFFFFIFLFVLIFSIFEFFLCIFLFFSFFHFLIFSFLSFPSFSFIFFHFLSFSFIYRVFRCCCNFFRRNPRRFHDFVSECVSFPRKINNPFWEVSVFRRKVTIFIGRETKTHILPTKINETHSPRSARPTIIILLEYHCAENDYSFDALQTYCFEINIKL